MLADVTFSALDPAILKLIISVAIPIAVMLFPQMKQPLINILQSLLDALSGLPTVVKSNAGPTDAQTVKAWRTLQKRCTCPEKKKALDDAAMNALSGEAK